MQEAFDDSIQIIKNRIAENLAYVQIVKNDAMPDKTSSGQQSKDKMFT